MDTISFGVAVAGRLRVVWGFGIMKWMMGWMHDTLEYFQKIRCIESTIKMN
jgi:hypothetical protein